MVRRGGKIKVAVAVILVGISAMVGLGVAGMLGRIDEEVVVEQAREKTRAEKVLEGMTLEEKCAQLFIVRLTAVGAELNTKALTEGMRENLAESKVGGVVLFSGNIGNPEQLKKLVSEIKAASAVPPFVAVDEEGGIVSRIGNNKAFGVEKIPAASKIGGTGDAEVARRAALVIADYLKEYGFNVDFAPVADVNSNPRNVVIGTRAFGSDPEEVAAMVEAQVGAFTEAGVIATAKHFPGHGDTDDDTHLGTTVVRKSLEELEVAELVPFRAAIAAGVPMVMVAHITVPEIDESGLPATLSEVVMTEILRERLGFDGVIITDGMEMKAISEHFASDEAAVRALKAGADIVLIPEDFKLALDGVVRAAESGEIGEEVVEEKVLRVLEMKERFGVL